MKPLFHCISHNGGIWSGWKQRRKRERWKGGDGGEGEDGGEGGDRGEGGDGGEGTEAEGPPDLLSYRGRWGGYIYSNRCVPALVSSTCKLLVCSRYTNVPI